MKKLLICAAISTMLFTGCTGLKSSEGVIKVNGTVITQAQFDKAFDKEIDNSMLKAFGGAANFLKSDENMMYLVYKEKVSRELIVKTLLDNEIAKRGIKVSEADINNEMRTIIDKVGSKEELYAMLNQRGISNSEFKEDLKTQIKMKKLISSIKKVSISDADTLKYYKSNIDKFKTDEQVRASHILISSDVLETIRALKSKNKDMSPEELNKKVEEIQAQQKAKAENVLKEVKANPDNFEKLAKKYSDDKASALRGGELGYFQKKAMVPEFSNVAFAMKPNTISDNLVRTGYGYHIIKVVDHVAPGTTPYAKAKDEIKFYLETEAQMKVLKDLTDGLMKSAQIEYVDSSFNPENIGKQALKIQKEGAKQVVAEKKGKNK